MIAIPFSTFALSGETTLNTGNFVIDAINSQDSGISKILEKPQEEKDIQNVQEVLSEFTIKKEINEKLLAEITNDVLRISAKLQSNEGELSTLSGSQDTNLELANKYDTLLKENQTLKKEVFFKESLISNLKDSIDSYKLLEVKYQDILGRYVEVQKQKTKEALSIQNQKFIILFVGVIGFIGLYFLKIFLRKKDIIKKSKENFYAYYDLLYAIVLIIFIITYLFYLFPQLYILLVFVSGSIIWANAVLISSFVSSLIIFRKFVIGDIIGIGPDIGKIVKITPLHTIIRKINEHGIVDGDEMSIPNINLIKDAVNVINDIHLKDHYFSIVLSLKNNQYLFEILDEIKEDILLKFLKHRPQSINSFDEDFFKTKYEYIDAENIKVTFYWIGADDLNRKIEKNIISYIKGTIFDSLEKKNILTFTEQQ